MAGCYKYQDSDVVFNSLEEIYENFSQSKINNESILRFIDLKYPIDIKVITEEGKEVYHSVYYNKLNSFVKELYPNLVSDKDIYNKVNDILSGNSENVIALSLNSPVNVSYSELKILSNARSNQFIVAIDENNKVVFGTKKDIRRNIELEGLSGDIRYKVANVKMNNSRELKTRMITDSEGNDIYTRDEVVSWWEFRNGKPKNGKNYSVPFISSLVMFDSLNSNDYDFFGPNFIVDYENSIKTNTDILVFNKKVDDFLSSFNVVINRDKDGITPFTERNNKNKEIISRKNKLDSFFRSKVYDLLKLKDDNGNDVFTVTQSEVIAPAPNGAVLGISSDTTKSEIDDNTYGYFRNVVEGEFKSELSKIKKSNKYLFNISVNDELDIEDSNNTLSLISKDLKKTIKRLENIGIPNNNSILKQFIKLDELIDSGKLGDSIQSLKSINNLASKLESKFDEMFEQFYSEVTSMRVHTYEKSLSTIYNRTPGQGMQSFFLSKTASFSTGNIVRMSEHDAVIQGGDYDGDALSQFFYSLNKLGGILKYSKYLTDGKIFKNDSEVISNYSNNLFYKRLEATLEKISDGLSNRENSDTFNDEERNDLKYVNSLLVTNGNVTDETLKFVKKYKSKYSLSAKEMEIIDDNLLLSIVDEKNKIFEKELNDALSGLLEERNILINKSESYLKEKGKVDKELFAEILKLDKKISKEKTILYKSFIGSIKNFIIDNLKESQLDPLKQIEASISVDSKESKLLADKFSDPEYILNNNDGSYDLVVTNYGNSGVFAAKHAISVGNSAIGVVANTLALLSTINKYSIGMNELTTAFNNGSGITLSYPNNFIDDNGIVTSSIESKIVMNPEEIQKQISFNIDLELNNDEVKNIKSLIDDGVIESINGTIFNENKKSSYRIHGPAVWEFLSELMTDAVDNAKLLMLDKLGITKESLPYVLSAVASGFQLSDVIYFLNQREVKKIFSEVSNGTNINNAINTELEVYTTKYSRPKYIIFNNSVVLHSNLSKLESNGILDKELDIIFNNTNSKDLTVTSLPENLLSFSGTNDLVPVENIDNVNTIVNFGEGFKEGLIIEDTYSSEIVYYIDNYTGNLYILDNGRLRSLFDVNLSKAIIAGKVFIKGESNDKSSSTLNRIIENSYNDNKSNFRRTKNHISTFDIEGTKAKAIYVENKKDNNPLNQLSVLVNVTEEYSFIQAILGFKNGKNNSSVDMKKYRNKIIRAGNKLIKRFDEDSKFELDSFINNPIYRDKLMKSMDGYKVAINPFVVSYGIKSIRTNLDVLNTEKLLDLAIPKNRIINKIYDGIIPIIDNKSERAIELWIGGTAIADYFDKNSITVKYKDAPVYDLSSMIDRNRLVHDFSKIITDAKNDDRLSSNTLINYLTVDSISNNSDENINLKFVNLINGANPQDLESDLIELKSLSPELFNIMKYYSLIITRGNPRDNDIYNIFNDIKSDYEKHLNSFIEEHIEDLENVTPEVLLLSNPLLRNYINSDKIKYGNKAKVFLDITMNGKNVSVPLIKKSSFYGLPRLLTKSEMSNNTLFGLAEMLGYQIGYLVNIDDNESTDSILYYDYSDGLYIGRSGAKYTAELLFEYNSDMYFKASNFGMQSELGYNELDGDMTSIEDDKISNFKLAKKEEIPVVNGNIKYKIINRNDMGNAKEGDNVGIFNIGEMQYELIYKTSLSKYEFNNSDLKGLTGNLGSGYDTLQNSRNKEKFVIVEIKKLNNRTIPWGDNRITSKLAKSHNLNTMFKFMTTSKLPSQLSGGKKAFISKNKKIHSLKLKGFIKYTDSKSNRVDEIINIISNNTFNLNSSIEAKNNFLKKNIGYDSKYKTYTYKWINGELNEENPEGLYIISNVLESSYGFINSSEEEDYLSTQSFDEADDILENVTYNTSSTNFIDNKLGSTISRLGVSTDLDNNSLDILQKISNEHSILSEDLETKNLQDSKEQSVIFNQINDNDILVIETSSDFKEINNKFTYKNIDDKTSRFIENIKSVNNKDYTTVDSILDEVNRLSGLSDSELAIYGIDNESLVDVSKSLDEYKDADLKIPMDMKMVFDNEYYLHIEIAKKLNKSIYVRITNSDNNNGNWAVYNPINGYFEYMQEVPKLGNIYTDTPLNIAIYSNESFVLRNLIKAYANNYINSTKKPEHVPFYERIIDYSNPQEVDDNIRMLKSIPSNNNLDKVKVKNGLVDGKKIDEIDIKNFNEYEINSYNSGELIVLSKDGDNYIVYASDNEITESDGFNGLRTFEDGYLRNKNKIYKFNKMFSISDIELEYRKSTTSVNTDIVNEANDIKSFINSNNTNKKIEVLLSVIPYYNNIDINPLHSSISFFDFVNMLKNGDADQYATTSELKSIINDIIKVGDKKAIRLKTLKETHNKLLRKNKLKLLSVESSNENDNHVKIFFRPQFGTDISNIKKNNAYSNVFVTNKTSMKQMEGNKLRSMAIDINETKKDTNNRFKILFEAILNNPKETFYIEIPSIKSEISNGVTFGDAIKSFVSVAIKNRKFSEAVKTGRIKFGKNASKMINNTDGKHSYLDMNPGKIVNVFSTGTLNTLKLRGEFNLNNMEFGDGTLMEEWFRINNIDTEKSNKNIYDVVGDTSIKQKELTALLKRYFIQNKSELIQFMQKLGSKDLYTTRSDSSYSLELSIAEIINDYNNLEFINGLELKAPKIIDTEPQLMSDINDGVFISYVKDFSKLSENNITAFYNSNDGIKIIKRFKEIEITSSTNSIPNISDKLLNKFKDEVINTGNPVNITLVTIDNSDINISDNKENFENNKEAIKDLLNPNLNEINAIEQATIFMPILAKGNDIELNNNSDNVTKISKLVGNDFVTDAGSTDVVWIKSSELDHSSGVYPSVMQDVFNRNKPLIQYYINKGVKFALSTDISINNLVKKYLENKGYSFNSDNGLFEQSKVRDTRDSVVFYKSNNKSQPSILDADNTSGNKYGMLNYVFESNDINFDTQFNISVEGILSHNDTVESYILSNIKNELIFKEYRTEDGDNSLFNKQVLKEKKFIDVVLFLNEFPDLIDPNSKDVISDITKVLSKDKDVLDKFNILRDEFNFSDTDKIIVGTSHLNATTLLVNRNNINVSSLINKYTNLRSIDDTFSKFNNVVSESRFDSISSNLDVLGLYLVASAIHPKSYKNYNKVSMNTVAVSQLFVKENINGIKLNNGNINLFNEFSIKKNGLKQSNIMSGFNKVDIDTNPVIYALLKSDNNTLNRIANMIIRTKPVNIPISSTKDTENGHDILHYHFKDSVRKIESLTDIKNFIVEDIMTDIFGKLDIELSSGELFNLKKSDFAKSILNTFYYNDTTLDSYNITSILFGGHPNLLTKETDVPLGSKVSYNIDGNLKNLFAIKRNVLMDSDGIIYNYSNGKISTPVGTNPISISWNTSIDKGIATPKQGEYSSIVINNDGNIDLIVSDVIVRKELNGDYTTVLDGDNYIYSRKSNSWIKEELDITTQSFNVPINVGYDITIPDSKFDNKGDLKTSVALSLENGTVAVIKPNEYKSISKDKVVVNNDLIYKFSSEGKYNTWKILSKDFNDTKFRPEISEVQYKGKTLKQMKVSSKVMIDILNFFKETYDTDIQYINSGEIEYLFPGFGNETAFVKNGIIYMNSDKATLDAPVHELGHLYLSYIKYNDPTMYNYIITESLKNTTLGNEIKSVRDNLSDIELGEEIFTTLLGYDSQSTVVRKTGNSFMRFIKEFFSKLFGIKSTDLSIDRNMSINDIINNIGKDIMFGKNTAFKDY